jgi:hypothetical protein
MILLANFAATLFLTGLSWFLQVVHFPILARLDTPDFSIYATMHRRRNTLLMAPAMVVELATAAWLGVATPAAFSHRDMFHAFLLVVMIWLITFFRHVPLHRKLLGGYDAQVLQTLIRWNWIRTCCWSGRAVFLLFLVHLC